MRGRARRGFTLIELAVVLAVLSIMVGGIMTVVTQEIRRKKMAELNAKLDTIEAALISYRKLNDSLPCPSVESYTQTDQYFGVAAATNSGTCAGGTPSVSLVSSNTVGGNVPSKTLGLPDEYMFDPWGDRFTYMVDKRATASSAFTTYGIRSSTQLGSITVNDGGGNARTTTAILAIISHGPNGHGSFQLAASTRKNYGTTNTNELENCECDSSATATSFDAIIVAAPATMSSSTNLLTAFDDVVRYYSRTQFLSSTETLSESR